MNFPEEIHTKYENRKEHEEKITAEKKTKLERQKQVYLLNLQGFKNQEIADNLQVSLSTIEKDLHEIREQSKSWFIEMTKNGMGKSFVDAYFQLSLVERELWSMFRQTIQQQLKIKLLSEIADTAFKKKDLFWANHDPKHNGYGVMEE